MGGQMFKRATQKEHMREAENSDLDDI